jgi:hypothetical protein
MKRTLLILSAIIVLAACNNQKKSSAPDVTTVLVDMTFERFDYDFFRVDTNNLVSGLDRLYDKYPNLTPIYLQHILGLDSASTLEGVKRFIAMSRPIQDTVEAVFGQGSRLEKDFNKPFRYVKYYFPQYKLPKQVITIVGPVDALQETANGLTPNLLGPDELVISLQFYLGANFSVYNSAPFIDGVAPLFRSRRFSPAYMVPEAMLLIVDDLFPDKSEGRPLIEQMIEKGKQWWLLDKFLPDAPDSVKAGYTGEQIEWCKANEGQIWSYLVKNEDIYSINPSTIQTYIGEAPSTSVFPNEGSPGNIGPWIGWQIIKKYAERNPRMTPDEVMKTPAKTILEESKYKP